ncbi:MAG: alpha/beta fold hydrolase [Xenococcaceae cyanobacterium MO_188.B32]|nr:alpha/beta fold hydrolase [Xenococcaceae cyanobacterium MO_188.B32]
MDKRPWYDLNITDPHLNELLLYYLGSTWQGMADIGECLDTVSRVEAEKEDSWSREWRKTAKRIRKIAKSSEAKGHLISAGEAYLRAANYYMAALHRYPKPQAPDVAKMAQQSTHCFHKALEHLPLHGVPVEIPYENTMLPGYFFHSPSPRGKKAPVLIVHPGRDTWAEQCKFLAEGAIKRGYHCLLFDGPGQGKVIRLQGLTCRPDWEKVVTPVVDFAICQAGVDPERIALMGLSMGGSLAPRAAAFEQRLKICIANPGVYSWTDLIYGLVADYLRITPAELEERVKTDPKTFNEDMAAIMETNALVRWYMEDEMWKYGVTSSVDLMLKLKAFTNEGIAEQISCRTLVMNGTLDDRQQAEELYEALNAPKDYMLFTEEDTAMLHCQIGALAVSSGRMFDWLDEYL